MNIILTFCFAAFCTIQTISCDCPIVEVEQGLLRGKLREACTGDTYTSFENIPYAKPPIGSRRFKAPEEPDKWEGTRDATKLGPMCPQYNPLSKILNNGSEDCLTLNVYSSNLTGNLPVLVIFIGFAFAFNPDDNTIYKPDFLVNRTVVVTFQDRVDAPGYLKLGKSVPGNAGLKDQRAMLKWVNKNIHKFGGNPNCITLVGISSGAASIHYHMTSPLSRCLFHRVYLQSGVPSCDAIYPYKVEEMSRKLAKKLGIDTEDEDELLTRFQDLPLDQLVNSSYALAVEDDRNVLMKKMAAFVPSVENDYGQERMVTKNPTTALKDVFDQKYQVMIGYTSQEALIVVDQYADYLIDAYSKNLHLLVPNKILWKVTTDVADEIADRIKKHFFKNEDISVKNIAEFVKCNSQSNMAHDVIKYAEAISELTETYMLKFSSISGRNTIGQAGLKYGIEGVAHGDPINYWFNVDSLPIDPKTCEMIKQYVDSILNFAETGKPGANWKPYTKERKEYMEFTDKMEMKTGLDEDNEFWDKMYAGIADIHLYE